MENRRRINRQPASWVGSCRLAGEPAASWRECRVVDISILGVAITFDRAAPSELLPGRLIFVDISADGGIRNVCLEGEIKNVAPTTNGGVRAGIGFIRVSEKDRAISAVLSAISEAFVAESPAIRVRRPAHF